jgi:hypothetical protein
VLKLFRLQVFKDIKRPTFEMLKVISKPLCVDVGETEGINDSFFEALLDSQDSLALFIVKDLRELLEC